MNNEWRKEVYNIYPIFIYFTNDIVTGMFNNKENKINKYRKGFKYEVFQ